jgi:hypothetical protein
MGFLSSQFTRVGGGAGRLGNSSKVLKSEIVILLREKAKKVVHWNPRSLK